MKTKPDWVLNAILVILLWNVIQPPGCVQPIIDPDPAPIPAPGFRVLVVEETEERQNLPQDQLNALMSTTWREYCDQHCVKVDNVPEYRVFDQNQDMEHESDIWKAAMARPRTQLPWIIVSNGKTGVEKPYPANLDEKMALLRQYTPQEP